MSGTEVKVKTFGFTYPVCIENNSLVDVGRLLRRLFSSTRTLLVSDSRVYSLYGRKVLSSLEESGWQAGKVLFRPGERSKTLTGASRLYDAAVDAGLDRTSPIIALGGGVTGDLAGFTAATYLRGIPLVMLPTSLLAQVDSSVGGKVAVNHPHGKNLIGAFYPPRIVIVDPLVLKTLPLRQLKAGLAEVIKYGIIMEKNFFQWLEINLASLLKAESPTLAEAVAASIRYKAKVVEQDEYEADYRRILNFGHTIGHALEAATGYKYYLHGEAVLIGMYAATGLALKLSMIGSDEARRIQKLLLQVGLKKPPAGLTSEPVICKLRHDKKRREDEFIFVLPGAIGSVTMIPVKEEQLIQKVIKEYLSL